MDSKEIEVLQKVIDSYAALVESVIILKKDQENLRRRIFDLELNQKLKSKKVVTGIMRDLEEK